MNRRNFLKTTAVAASVAAVGSTVTVFASDSASHTGISGIVYSKDQQGQWEGKAGSHAPEVTVAGGKVIVTTLHPMSEAHFIVRHTVVLADGKVIGGATFTAADQPTSTVKLPANYKGKACATSFCNKHDLWMTEFTV